MWHCDLFPCLVELLTTVGEGRQVTVSGPGSCGHRASLWLQPLLEASSMVGGRGSEEALSARFPDQILDQRCAQASRMPGPRQTPVFLWPRATLQVHVQCCLAWLCSHSNAAAGESHGSKNREGPHCSARSGQEELEARVSLSWGAAQGTPLLRSRVGGTEAGTASGQQ